MGESDVSKGTSSSNSTKNVETKDPHKQAGDDTEIVLDIKNDGKIVFEESSEGLCLVSSFSTPTREKFGVKIGDTLVAVRIHSFLSRNKNISLSTHSQSYTGQRILRVHIDVSADSRQRTQVQVGFGRTSIS